MQTLEELGIRTATVEKVEVDREIEKLMAGDPPGLMINGKLVWSGGTHLPKPVQIAEWIGEVVARG
jgi:hypothetical protein